MACKYRIALRCLGLAWIVCLWSAIPLTAQDSSPGSFPTNHHAQAAGTDPAASEPNPPASDLAAAAKLARDQRARQQTHRTELSQAVNEMANDLAREQDEPIPGAPVGYRYYYFKEGDYAILVPADAKPEVRDSYGLRLRSSEALTSSLEVILGPPVPALGDTPEEKIHNANATYFEGCALNISGLSSPVDGHPASGTGFSQCSLSRELLGSAELVLGDGYVVPVICGYPLTAQDLDPSPHQPIKRIVNKYDRERNGFNVCKLILPSLRFHPYGNRWNPKSSPTTPKKSARVTNALAPSANNEMNPGSGGDQSLGTFVRAHKKAPTREVVTELRHSAAGYTAFSFRYYCTEDRANCYSLSLQIPSAAKRNEQFLMPYIGLFQFEVPAGNNVAIIQATTGPPSESGIVTREEMINTKVDWFIAYVPAAHYSGVGPAKVLDEQLTEYSAIPTRLSTFRNPTSSEPVLTYMASYMVPGKFVHVRCTIPEKISGDLQSMCETVLRSIELQSPKPVPVAQDDPPTRDDSSSEPPEREDDDR